MFDQIGTKVIANSCNWAPFRYRMATTFARSSKVPVCPIGTPARCFNLYTFCTLSLLTRSKAYQYVGYKNESADYAGHIVFLKWCKRDLQRQYNKNVHEIDVSRWLERKV